MNKEIKKAIRKSEKKEKNFYKWRTKKYKKIWRIILFPLWIIELSYNKINKELNNKIIWSDKRANKILQYYVPRRSEWVKKEKAFYFFDNGMGWSFYYAKKYLKFKDYFFWKKFGTSECSKIRKYLIENFELKGFKKTIIEYKNGLTDIKFEKNI